MINNENTMIYVVIPVYNCKNYLEKAVNSVLNQPYKNLKIVCVDDGSTDGSSDLCDELAKKKSGEIITIHQSNQGYLLQEMPQ